MLQLLSGLPQKGIGVETVTNEVGHSVAEKWFTVLAQDATHVVRTLL